jgi:hypothetical protein
MQTYAHGADYIFQRALFDQDCFPKIELNQILGVGSFYTANAPRIIADFRLKINPIQEKVPIND